MAYTLVRHLSDSTSPSLDNEANISQWLLNLCEFAALFFKKYCNTDMLGLLNYLLNKMRRDNEYNQIVLLKEIVVKMFGWSSFNINEMSTSQLSSLAGGFCLKLELMN